MKTILSIFTLLFFSFVSGQSDLVSTSEGALKINPIHHGSIVFEFDGKTIYIDPHGGVERYTSLPKPDLILITDIHGDHMNKGMLEALDTKGAEIITAQAVADQLRDIYGDKITVIDNGEKLVWSGIQITAIPMYNLPETVESRHPKGRGNGYILTFDDKQVYISGDTEDIPEMRRLKDIDVAFVCMNLPYTMDVDQAASAVIEFSPKIVYPYHYRGQGGLSDVDKFKRLVNEGNDQVEVRLRGWYD